MTPNRTNRRLFQIGHVSISLMSKERKLLERVGDWMDIFEVERISEDRHVRFSLIGFARNDRVPFRLPAGAALLYRNDYTSYYEYRNLWIILLQSATVIVNRTSNKILALAHTDDLSIPKYLEDFMHPLMELLRQNRVYAHHAAAVSKAGRGLLIVGKSGQGKTTLSVDLLSRGFDFLADDRCFILDRGQGLEVLGFYEPIRYFSTNVSHIREIARTGEENRLPPLRNGKKQLDLQSIYQEHIIRGSRLTGLVFPHYSPDETVSRIEPMPPGEALITLLPLTMVCFDRTTSNSHFQFCVKMTTTLPAVKLIMGQDRERWRELVDAFLDAIPPGETTASSDRRDGRYN